MTKESVSSEAKVLIETSLEGIFAELQDMHDISGDISPDHQSLLDKHIEEMAELIASNILWNQKGFNEPANSIDIDGLGSGVLRETALINVTFADGTIWSGNFETLKIKLL